MDVNSNTQNEFSRIGTSHKSHVKKIENKIQVPCAHPNNIFICDYSAPKQHT